MNKIERSPTPDSPVEDPQLPADREADKAVPEVKSRMGRRVLMLGVLLLLIAMLPEPVTWTPCRVLFTPPMVRTAPLLATAMPPLFVVASRLLTVVVMALTVPPSKPMPAPAVSPSRVTVIAGEVDALMM